MSRDSRLIRSAEPLTAVVDGETVMFSPRQGSYFSLDEVGTRIWQLLEGPHSIIELCAILTDEFEVDRETCERDVAALIRRLADVQLVREVT